MKSARFVAFGVFAVLGAPISAGIAEAAEKPVATKDHWHAAYGVWNCGRWMPNIDVADDPSGIHTHGDGLIHIHPFTDAAAGKNAILKRFFEATGMSVTSSAIKLPSGPTLKAGSDCKGKKAAVSALIWQSPKSKKAPRAVRSEFDKIRLTDQQVIAFVFDDRDKNPGMPPSISELIEPADLPLPELSAAAMKKLPKLAPKPALTFTGTSVTKTTSKDISVGTGAELKNGMRAYMRYVLYLPRTKQEMTSDWTEGEQPYALARLGKKRNLAGLDKGLVGMKVGGVREIAIPPVDGFGKEGNAPITGTDTIVFYVQLVSVAR